ncbi:sigma-70 family RNA polymerase sigma factor [Candidatus Poribacteria bacterium]|nr:sigma-70 family RNA polymerase sigma factor [Candidatus Poribacteria bacterium]
MTYDDSDLIQQTLEGDQQAFAVLVEKYQKQIHALAWQKIGDFHIAQEITQDAFFTAFQKLSTLTNHNRFAGWLYVITNRKCIAWHRKKVPQPQSLEATDHVELEEVYYSEYMTQQREEAAKQKRHAIVQKLLSNLQESERTVVNLYYIAEMTCEDIGRFLGVSPNTVRSRLFRARNRLKKEEAMIKENLSSFKLPTQLTDNIMQEISRLHPVTPSSSKPLVPLAISAASAIIVLLLIGFGAQDLIQFQKPYSLESASEQTVEIVDVQLAIQSTIDSIKRNRVGRSEITGRSNGVGKKSDTPLLAAAQSDEVEISKSKKQWVQTKGPYGGEISTLFATSEGILFAGIHSVGIFRSTDIGDSWSPVNVRLSDAQEEHEVYVNAFAQKEGTIYAGISGKLYTSTDSGISWHYVQSDLQGVYISGIVIIGDRIYISSYQNGVWYTDDGTSWMGMNEGLEDLRIREFANIGTTLVIGTEDGAFRKKTTEDSWHPINSGFSAQPIDKEQMNRSFIESGLDPPPRHLLPSGIRVDSIAAMDNLIYMGVYMGKDKGVFRSDDEGDSWTRITAKEMKRTVEALTVFESTLYASTFGGSVFRSNDKGDTWIPVGEGLTDETGKGLVAISADTVLASTLSVGIFRTKDGGTSWRGVNTGIMSTSVVDLEVLGDRIYALTGAGSRLFYSANGGDSWESIEVPPKPINFYYKGISALNGKLYVSAVRFAPNSHGGVVGGVFQLDEKDNSLIEVKTDREMYAIECMYNVGTTFFIGTQGQGVFLWNEGWDSWLNLGLERQFIREISVSETDVYARVRQGKIYRLKDHQKTWEPISDTMARRKFSQFRKIDNKLYALSAREGLLRSVDGGNSWIQLKEGVEQLSIETVEINGTDFYVGTTQHGVFKWLHEDEKWEQLGSLSHPVQALAVLDGFLYAGTAASIFRIEIEK